MPPATDIRGAEDALDRANRAAARMKLCLLVALAIQAAVTFWAVATIARTAC